MASHETDPFQGLCGSIEDPTVDGELTLMIEHENLITDLQSRVDVEAGLAEILKDEGEA